MPQVAALLVLVLSGAGIAYSGKNMYEHVDYVRYANQTCQAFANRHKAGDAWRINSAYQCYLTDGATNNKKPNTPMYQLKKPAKATR